MRVKAWSRRRSARDSTSNRLPDFPVGVYGTRTATPEPPAVDIERGESEFTRDDFMHDLTKATRPMSTAEAMSDEDREDLKAAEKALRDAKTEGTVPWEQIKDDLDL